MAFVPFNNVIKLEGIYFWDGQYVENVHHYLVDETPNVGTAQSLAASYIDWWSTVRKSACPLNVTLSMVRCTIMETASSPGVEVTTGLPQSGTYAMNALPNSVTMAVKWSTGLRGRSYRGRTFIVGMTEDMVSANTLDPYYVNLFQIQYTDLIAMPTDVGPAVMCIASRISGGQERITGVATPVISMSIDPIVDNQRRRLPSRGR